MAAPPEGRLTCPGHLEAPRTGSRPGIGEDRCECPAGLTDAARAAGLEAGNRALREDNARLRLVLDSATDHAIVTMDIEGCVTSWNVGAQAAMGYTEAEMLGRSGEILFTSEDRAEGVFGRELCRAIEHGTATNERWHLRRDGSRFWASGTMMPVLDGEGRPQGFLNILRDRTDARAEAERRELLVAEMSHRIKNMFATVQAVAAQTWRYAPAPADFLAAFGARLLALARCHDVLIRAGWDDAPLRSVVEGALAPYRRGAWPGGHHRHLRSAGSGPGGDGQPRPARARHQRREIRGAVRA